MKKRTFISRHAKVFLSLMICLLFMLALVPAPASAADPITIKVNGVTLETDSFSECASHNRKRQDLRAGPICQ